jgi:hypothetical protein
MKGITMSQKKSAIEIIDGLFKKYPRMRAYMKSNLLELRAGLVELGLGEPIKSSDTTKPVDMNICDCQDQDCQSPKGE